MRKETEILSHQINNNTVFSILNESVSPFATHITIPTGISTSEEMTTKQLAEEFTLSLKALDLSPTPTSSTRGQNQNKNSKELNFGAPQIDLSLPSGTLAKDGIHEFNPKHYKDQNTAFKTALSLAAREISAEETKPIFCFLTEDQTHLIKWLSSSEIETLGLSKENLIVITGKHTDDILWAMEETFHSMESVALVAHFTLLSNIAAQRLSFTAKDKQIPCLLICNHKIEGPNHTRSRWSIWSETTTAEEVSFDFEKVGIATNLETNDEKTTSWIMRWQPEKGRFSLNLSEENSPKNTSIH